MRMPREYSLNFCGDEIEAPRTDYNKEPWVVFSDRGQNNTLRSAGGRVKEKDVSYLQPFFVTKEKGDYLYLVKYDPDALKKEKLDKKKAKPYGWMHKSKLMLSRQSVTDIVTGRKNKSLVVFGDTSFLNNPSRYFASDSILVYKDTDMDSVAGQVTPYSIVYRLKQSEANDMTLISRKPYLKVDEIDKDVLGWVDNSLIRDVGTGFYVNLASIPRGAAGFVLRKNREISSTEEIIDMNRLLGDQYHTLKYSPVSYYSSFDSLVSFKTRVVMPVFDHTNNCIYSVNRRYISYDKYRTLSKGLKKINVCFVFEGKDEAIFQLPQIANALYGLYPMFEEANDPFSYQFGCVMTFSDKRGSQPVKLGLTDDYSSVMSFLQNKAGKLEHLRALEFSRTWPGLREAADMFDSQRDATNVIVLIGDKGFSTDGIDPLLAKQLVKNNCRIIGFQTYAGSGNVYNNFVLDVENMISAYADDMLKEKRNILVSLDQIRYENRFREIDGIKNAFSLDFPDNSITQGFLYFPQKGESLPMEVLTNNIDTIIRQIKYDNDNTIKYMSRSFRSVGKHRTEYDSLFVRNYGVKLDSRPRRELINSFTNENPGWYMPSRSILLTDTEDKNMDYRILVSEHEMKEMKEFLIALSQEEVEYEYIKEKRAKKRKPCNCPDDDLFAEEELLDRDFEIEGAPSRPYASTKKVRKYLGELYIEPIKYCKVCGEKERILRTMTLAEAHYRIFGLPTADYLLNSIRIKDLQNNRIVTDKMLDDLVRGFIDKRKELDKSEKFESNGETYYWVDRKNLP